MAMDWPLKGHARTAMGILCSPERSQPAVLRRALAAVRGSGVLHDGEIYDLLGDAKDYYEYNPEVGRLRLASTEQPPADTSTVTRMLASTILGKAKAMELASPEVQEWYVARPGQGRQSTQPRATGALNQIRTKESLAGLLTGLIGSTAIRTVLLGSANHTRASDPHTSYASAAQQLATERAGSILMGQAPMPFAEQPGGCVPAVTVSGVEAQGLFLPVVCMVQVAGVYSRDLVLAHRKSGRRIAATQHVMLERVDHITVDPDWAGELLGASATPASGPQLVADAYAGTFREFLAAGDETTTPLASTLHAVQRWTAHV